MSLPLVAIVGAPNVGKSTLFNRLVGRRHALVTDLPGMTRDRLYGEVHDVEHPFRLVDTGGLTPLSDAPFAREIESQAEAALREAALILFVVDARAGAGATEHELVRTLRRRNAPLIFVANKVDSDKQDMLSAELSELGLGTPLGVSAEHGRGIVDLLDRIDEHLKDVPAGTPEDDSDVIQVAIVGRPNVGKSSLLNRLVGEERMMVSEIAGTTRDSVDTMLEFDGRRYRLIDTAGIRRPGRVVEAAERFSVVRARQNIERSDVVVLVLDGTEPLAAQDTHIAGAILDAYKPMVVAVNKWDIVEGREAAAKHWIEEVADRLRFAKQVPMVLTSAMTGQRVATLLDKVDESYAMDAIRVPTTELNRWLHRLVAGNPDAPPPRSAFRLYYATQIGIHPPRFLLFCNDPKRAHFSTRRQLANQLRERFQFGSAPLRLHFRARREPNAR